MSSPATGADASALALKPAKPFRPWGRWVWLVYLPLFFVSWPQAHPSTAMMLGGAAGVIVFLPIYLSAPRPGEPRLLATAAAILAFSMPLALTGGIWTVIAIYGAALAGEIRPFRRATIAVIVFAGLASVYALIIGQPFAWWGYGVFMMVVAGLGSASRLRLKDQNRALAEARSEVRRLAEIAERERIGRDLHDVLGRTLTVIALKAELAARLSKRDAETAEREMSEVAAAARSTLAEVRAAVQGMRGASLSHEVEASRAALAAAGVDCEFEGEAGVAPEGAGAVLAMVLREAVTNVIRHAEAKRCAISIAAADHQIRLTVQDDGEGGDLAEGGGISGMRTRLRAGGGALAIDTGAAGTRVTATLPLGVGV